MSHTIRRKNEWQDKSWTLREYICIPGFYSFHSITLSEKSNKGRIAIAKYHSDAGSGSKWCMTAPRWYRRCQNKKGWRKLNIEAKRFIKGEVEDILPISDAKNASWYY
jgi:hypothetical protein